MAVMCCLCVVFLEARSNKLGTRTHEERTARPSYQQNLYGARAMSFAWLMLVDLQFVFVVSCCLLALSCRGGLRCHVGGYTWGRTINEPATPPRVALLAELNCRCACEMFVFSWKCELFLWVCMVDGSHKRREGACFWATEIPPCRTPMSSNWALDVRN